MLFPPSPCTKSPASVRRRASHDSVLSFPRFLPEVKSSFFRVFSFYKFIDENRMACAESRDSALFFFFSVQHPRETAHTFSRCSSLLSRCSPSLESLTREPSVHPFDPPFRRRLQPVNPPVFKRRFPLSLPPAVPIFE